MTFNTEIFSQFDKKWALLTAGELDKFNTMTISWGGLGTIWNKSVATVYVRLSRYTHDFMDENEFFTVSFFPEDRKKVLAVLGSRSGREMDKIHNSGLTPVAAGKSVSFKEAEVTLLCRKLFRQRVELSNIPDDVVKACYPSGDPHDMYIGEVVDIIR
ncbi:MAG: flavin reductase family protein [Spirochaetales bacterium]|nr:flavin reductase family protein [Spirochaetales bacterium]